MGNWQEKIRQAFGARNAQERQRAEDQLRRKEKEEKLAIEEKVRVQQKLLTARRIFSNTRPDILLARVKRDVWGGFGEVTTFEVESNGDVYARLEYRRNGTFTRRSVSQGGSNSYSDEVGVYWDCFDIYAHSRGFVISSYNGFKEQGEYGNERQSDAKIEGIRIDGENYSKAKEDLEQAVMSICEPKIMSGTWPFKK